MKKIILSFMLIASSSLFAKSAKTILKENNCMKCHSIRGMKSAPPFSMITKMNSGWFGTSTKEIKNSIKNGSQGKYPMFSSSKMPSYENLSEKELDTIVIWLESQAQQGMKHKKTHNRKMMN